MGYNAEQKIITIVLVLGLLAVGLFTALRLQAPAAQLCFASSKAYVATLRDDSSVIRDGWAVEGDAFNQCVRRGEAAEASFHQRYPDGRYTIVLASTIGCHSPC